MEHNEFTMAPDASHRGFSEERSFYGVYRKLQRTHNVDHNCCCVEVHGRCMQLCPNSMFIFGKRNPRLAQFRYIAVWITESKWFEGAVLSLVIFNCMLLVNPSASRSQDDESFNWVEVLNKTTSIVFVVELALRCVARGVFFYSLAPTPCYLREAENWLNLVITIAGVVDFWHDVGPAIVVLRFSQIRRALRGTRHLPHIPIIVKSLGDSVGRMLPWAASVLFLFTVFAVAGQSMFGATYWNRCRLTPAPVDGANGTSIWEIDPAQDRFCGGRYSCREGTYCGSPVSRSDGIVVSYDVWDEVRENPDADYGYTGFHLFHSSVLSVLQVATMEGWTRLLFRYIDGEGPLMAILFFCSLLAFSGMVLMNLLLAILWNSFLQAVREDTKQWRAIRDPEVPIPPDIHAMKLQVVVAKVSKIEDELMQQRVFNQLDSDMKTKGLKNICYTIVAHRYFPLVMNALIVINSACLAMDSHPPLGENVSRLFEAVNFFCTVMFTFEVILKFLGLGVEFFEDGFNKFDLLCVLASLVEVLMDGSSSVSALRTARLLRLLKMMKMQVSIRVLFRVLRLAAAPTLNFTLIVCVDIFMNATIGFHMYKGFALEDPQYAQLSFESMYWSIMTVFTLLSGERWLDTMVLHAKQSSKGFVGILFFLVTLTFGKLVLMNLFVGMFAAMFTCSREDILLEYRERLAVLRMEAAAPTEEPAQAPAAEPEEADETPDSPRFSDTVAEKGTKTRGKEMHILKMMGAKKRIHGRRSGEAKVLAQVREAIASKNQDARDSFRQQLRLNMQERMQAEEPGANKGGSPMDTAQGTARWTTSRDAEASRRPPPLRAPGAEHAAVPPTGTSAGTSDSVSPRHVTPKASVSRAGDADGGLAPNTASHWERASLLPGIKAKQGSPEGLESSQLRKRSVRRSGDSEFAQCMPGLGGDSVAAVKRGRSIKMSSDVVMAAIPPRRRDERDATVHATATELGSGSDSAAFAQRGAEEYAAPPLDILGSGPPAQVVPSFTTLAPCMKEPEHRAALPHTCGGYSVRGPPGYESHWEPGSGPARVLDRQAAALSAVVAAAAEAAAAVAPHAEVREASRFRARFPWASSSAPDAPGSPLPAASARGPGSDQEAFGAPRCRKTPAPCHGAAPPADLQGPDAGRKGPGEAGAVHFADAPEEQEPPQEEPQQEEPLPLSSLEKYGRRIALHPRFEPTILVLIIISSICLALEDPFRPSGSAINIITMVLDRGLTFAFAGEMFIKMAAFGVCRESRSYPVAALPSMQVTTSATLAAHQEARKPYFKVGWNVIDFIAVLSGALDILLARVGVRSAAIRQMRTLRLVRVLRPLRLMKRFLGIRLLVEALISSLPTLANMMVIAMLFYLGFGILCVNTLKGSLWACSLDPDGTLLPDIVTKEDCLAAGGTWELDGPNFDNLFSSLLVLIHAGCGEGWIEVLLKVTNSNGIDLQPRPNARLRMGVLIALFVAMSNFLLLNLFIGVLVDQYVATKGELTDSDNLSLRDCMWLRMQRDVFLHPRSLGLNIMETRESYRPLKAKLCFDVESPWFHGFVYFLIVVNTLLLCMEHPTQSDGLRSATELGSNILVVLFLIEAALKLYAYRWSYFKNSWDVYDGTITIISCLSLVIGIAPSLRSTEFARFVDMFRVGRTVRLGRLPVLRPTFRTLWNLLPGLMNIVGLLTLVLFIYACLGVGLFGTLQTGDEIGPNASFHSFRMALLTLVRCSTGEKWNVIMREAASNQPGCTNELQSPEDLARDGPRGCGTWLSYPYFISFTLVVSVVLINMVVAIVLDGYQAVERVERLGRLKAHTADFVEQWYQAGSDSEGYLPLDKAIELFQELGHPFGFGFGGEKAKAWSVMLGLRHVPILEGSRVHIRDMMIVCAQRAFVWTIGGLEEDCILVKLDPSVIQDWYASFPGVPGRLKGIELQHTTGQDDRQMYVSHAYMARVMRARFQARRAQTASRANGTPLRSAGNTDDNLTEAHIPQAHIKHAVVMTGRTQRRLAEEMQRCQQQQQQGGVWSGWTFTPPSSVGAGPAGSPYITASSSGSPSPNPLQWPIILPPLQPAGQNNPSQTPLP